MKKQWLLNLFLLCVVAALAMVIFPGGEETGTAGPENLTTLDPAGVSRIHIEHNGHITELEKKAGEWRIVQPLEIAANDFRVKTILQLLKAPVHRRYSLEELDADKIGLSAHSGNSPTRVSFNDTELVFGIINPATGLRYIQKGNSVYTIEDVYSPLLTSHFGTLVSLNLLPAGSEITKLELLNRVISRNDRGNWQSRPAISADRINEIVDGWRYAQAFGIHAYMQRRPQGEVRIELRNRPPVRYIVTDTDPWIILARPETDLEYHLEHEAYDRLLSPQ